MKTTIIFSIAMLTGSIVFGHQSDSCELVRYDSITTYNAWHGTNYLDRAELQDATVVINAGKTAFIAEDCK